jgi:hypothetical protein
MAVVFDLQRKNDQHLVNRMSQQLCATFHCILLWGR